MKILVTGGAGFVGSHLCSRLLKEGHTVFCVDNFSTGLVENIADFRDNPHFVLISGSVQDLENFYVEQIYHLASPASPVFYDRFPVETIQANVDGTRAVLELAKKVHARVLFTSTSEIYGDPEQHPQVETYNGNVNPTGPRSCYSKDTEVLTLSGWRTFAELENLETEVATVDSEQQVVFQKPTDFIKERYRGRMVSFKNGRVDLLVTPNHKMYVQDNYSYRRKSSCFELIEADSPVWEEYKYRKGRFLKCPSFPDRKEVELQVFPSKEPAHHLENRHTFAMDDWLEFLGYYISEGCCYCRKKSTRLVYIAQDKEKNPTKWQKIASCLKRLGLPVNYSNHQFVFCSKELYAYLKPLGKSDQKYIPEECLRVSNRQLEILVDALMLGDGHTYTDARGKLQRTYWTSSLRLANQFQRILLQLGLGGEVRKQKDRSLYYVAVKNERDREKSCRLTSVPKRSYQEYDDYVYCVTVPNRTLLVRRNGVATVSGNCYDESKRCGETLCSVYRNSFGVDARIVRIFNTYGPRMREDDGRVVSNFIIQALSKQDVTLYGDGTQTRSFQYVDDLIEGLSRVMSLDENHGPINLGRPEELTMVELAHKVLKMTGSDSNIVFRSLPKDDPCVRKPDITKAQELLSWHPQITLSEGLEKTIAHFRRKLQR